MAPLRPNTDYERWLRDSNPDRMLAAEPDYGQVQKAAEMDSALEYQPPLSNPQIYIMRDDKSFQVWENRPPFSTAYIIPVFVVIVAIIFIKTRHSRKEGAVSLKG
ncbi:hypothetical protein P170DRAFT_154813 [Aspergillus steynii IBT 23096]|uniref:Uncharacterized protein n=1 Tax=Aspergillus steynii IBT 23096 TaxID=1392250 RepID=A0A2I2GD37_9EURO|nr:uncharacterized protein P170DRAFT_154813 [Aspergillus steynii IBT 23096]PLB50793.1 hypothetical protein P170DRAFT_154813 [Aspergillus steynii IBT 23096]